MYEVSVQREFDATHAITMAGERETPHGHTWRVQVVIAGRKLDEDGLLCDFHMIECELDRLIDAFRDRDLNQTPPFDRLNPTAEHIARYLAEALTEALPTHVTLDRVSVTEAPGCIATYRMDSHDHDPN
jgi:6-pyruvoyltetrahydropterin/6-carboxytetrahydropterin synthase